MATSWKNGKESVQDTEQWMAGLLTLQFITRHVYSKTQVK